MLWGSQSDVVRDILRTGRIEHDAAQWEAIKAEADLWKPDGYDQAVGELRLEYEGKGEAALVEVLKKRHPYTVGELPRFPANLARLFADNAASTYDFPAQRYLEREGDDGKKITLTRESPGEDGQRATDFAVMLDEAQIDKVMAEGERRTVLTGGVFYRVHSDTVEAIARGKPGEPAPPRTKVQPFWTGDISVIPHPACPPSLTTCVCLIARTAGSQGVNGAGESYDLWIRSHEDDPETGLPVSFSPWRLQRVNTRPGKTTWRGERRTDVEIVDVSWRLPDRSVSDEYPLSLPWVAAHDGIVDGCPFLDCNRNLIPQFHGICAAVISMQFAVDMNGASPLVRKTDQVQPKSIALGPGIITPIPRDDDIVPVQVSADFEGMQDAIRQMLGITAMTNKQRADGFNIDTQQAESGKALQIKDGPQAKARMERIARAISVDEEVLTRMIEVHDFWRGTSIADPSGGVTARMRPTDPPDNEDRDVTTNRVLKLRDAGLASDEEVRVVSGLSRTEDEARSALEKIKKQKADALASNPRMRALLEASDPRGPMDPDEVDGLPPSKGSKALPPKPEDNAKEEV